MECRLMYCCAMCEKQFDCKIEPMEHNKRLIERRMEKVKHKILIMSNKGGVGKSTVTANLASAFHKSGYKVGIADADIHGPNIPKMLGVEGKRLKSNDEGITPLEISPNFKVASLAFLIERPEEPIVWRDAVKYDFITELFGSINWGELDYLFVDLPPGTGNESITSIDLIGKVDGSVVVTIPTEASLLDARKAVLFSKSHQVEVIGIVENMSGLICPNCSHEIDPFAPGGGEKLASALEVPFLGRVPLDREISSRADKGEVFSILEQDFPSVKAFKEIVKKCEDFVNAKV